MEMENKYGSKGVAGAGLGLGIAGTALGLMAGNGGFNLFGNNANCGCNEDHLVNRYELGQNSEIERLRTELSLRDANIYTDSKIADVYEKLNTKIGAVESELCQQRVYNATNTSAIACINGQIATLMALTKTVIPADNVCPQPMAMYNSWTAPTAPTAGA